MKSIKRDKNDILFSEMIRERDNYTCVFCGRRADQGYVIQNSHYWGRGDKSNRFNPDNCDSLCFTCHNKHESNKQGYYRTFKLKQLGKKKYDEMEKVHNQGYKKYGKFEVEILNAILKEQYKNKRHLKDNWKVDW